MLFSLWLFSWKLGYRVSSLEARALAAADLSSSVAWVEHMSKEDQAGLERLSMSVAATQQL